MTDQENPWFDLIVIGGGPSGSRVAEGATQAGMRVALIERDQLGGTCLNYGCDPTNAMIRAGEVVSLARRAAPLGVCFTGIHFEWPTLRAHISRMIDEIRQGDGVASVRGKGIHLIQGHARFLSRHTVQIGEEAISGDIIVIATGGSPVIPEIPGLREAGYLTNRDVFNLDALPRSIAVIGGGSHAMEFAQFFLNVGVTTTVITTDRRILPAEDADIAGELARLLMRDGMDIRAGIRAIRAQRMESGERCLAFTGPDGFDGEVRADAILVASEQRPAIDHLGLDRAGVSHSPKGIDVDALLRTSVPHIRAIGDATGIGTYTHVASYQAQVALHNILHPDRPKEADYRVVPRKVFTQPEIGRAGLTEAEARHAGHEVVMSSMPYRDQPRAITLNEREGLVKLIVDRGSHQVLGVHVLGAYASEVVAEVALVMQHGLPVTAIGETMHVHPTMGESVYWAAQNIRQELLTDPPPAP